MEAVLQITIYKVGESTPATPAGSSFRVLPTANCKAYPQTCSKVSGLSLNGQIRNNFCLQSGFLKSCTAYRNVGRLRIRCLAAAMKIASLSPDSTLPTKQRSQLRCYTFKWSSGTGVNKQSVWLLHCLRHCRTGPTGSWNSSPTQSLQNKKTILENRMSQKH